MTNRDLFDAIGMLDAAECRRALAPKKKAPSHGRAFRITAAVSAAAVLALTAGASLWIFSRLKRGDLRVTAPAAEPNVPASELQEILVQERTVPFDDISDAMICFMSPAYAPYALTVSAAEQQTLAAALEQAHWTEIDGAVSEPDGEHSPMYVYNNGTAFCVTQCNLMQDDRNVVKIEQNGRSRYYAVDSSACAAIAKAANPEHADTKNGNLTWCPVYSVNTEDIWKNFVVDRKECDMTTKDGIFYKMSNTCDYFDRASGHVYELERQEENFVPAIQSGGQVTQPGGSSLDGNKRWFREYQSAFSTDLCAAFSVEHTEVTLWHCDPARMLSDDSAELIPEGMCGVYTEPEQRYRFDLTTGEYEKMHSSQHRYVSQPVENDAHHWYDEEGTDVWQARNKITNCDFSDEAISPYYLALNYLYDFDNWEIAGNETVDGRECVRITGHLTGYPAQKQQVDAFEMNVDIETGILMKLTGYDSEGLMSRQIVVSELRLNDEAEDVERPDFTVLTEKKQP